MFDPCINYANWQKLVIPKNHKTLMKSDFGIS